jgi:opacity protein-like surface antigen
MGLILNHSIMKRLILSLLLVTLIFSVLDGQFTKIGGGVAYGTGYWFEKTEVAEYRSGHFAGFLEGVYEITKPIHVAASFSYFYPHREEYTLSKTSVSSMMFDINGHYVFNPLARFEFYGLAGMDFLLTWKKDRMTGTFNEEFTQNDNAFGLNLGAGTYFNLSKKIILFTEAKYVVSKYSQFMANAGVFLIVNWLPKQNSDQY